MSLLAACGGARLKGTRVVEASVPMAAGQEFRVSTQNDPINIQAQAGDTNVCTVKATITARGYTQDAVRNLALATKVILDQQADVVELKIEAPKRTAGQSVSVALDVTLPKGTKADLSSVNGWVTVRGMDGRVKAKSKNDEVELRDVSGDITAESENGDVIVAYSEDARRAAKTTVTAQNGDVTCDEIDGDVEIDAQNGDVEVSYRKGAGASPTVKIEAQNGSIDFTPPAGLDAKVDISTVNGTMDGELPMATQERTGKSLKGVAGEGRGSVTIHSQNGDISTK
jgi:hypothetical protein